MIHLNLGPEPPELTTVRQSKIAEVLAAATPPTSDLLTGYRPPTAQTLHDRQYNKCGWCERPVGRTGEPVEHIRPKGGAQAADGTVDPQHYWWLAWTWENLLFSCSSCNSPGNKGNRYYLLEGTERLPLPVAPVDPSWFEVSAESPVLIHPGYGSQSAPPCGVRSAGRVGHSDLGKGGIAVALAGRGLPRHNWWAI